MSTKTNGDLPDELVSLIAQVLQANGLDVSTITRLWTREMRLDNEKGVIAVVVLGADLYCAIINIPVLVMPTNGITLTFAQSMELVMSVSDIPGACYATSGDNLYFTYCAQMKREEDSQIPMVIDGLLNGVKRVRQDALTAFQHFYVPEAKPEENTIARPQLPNIKMTPDDARVIYGVLIRCDENTRSVYDFLMEKWARAGYIVETTSSSIVLDAPYGATRTRIAMLMPGISEEIARLNPGILLRSSCVGKAYANNLESPRTPSIFTKRLLQRPCHSIRPIIPRTSRVSTLWSQRPHANYSEP